MWARLDTTTEVGKILMIAMISLIAASLVLIAAFPRWPYSAIPLLAAVAFIYLS
jgi:hypothetical protein